METVLLPDAGPLTTLAYADALDLLHKPGWRVALVDMVLHEVTRNQTPTNQKISAWVARNGLEVIETRIHRHYHGRYERRAAQIEFGRTRRAGGDAGFCPHSAAAERGVSV